MKAAITVCVILACIGPAGGLLGSGAARAASPAASTRRPAPKSKSQPKANAQTKSPKAVAIALSKAPALDDPVWRKAPALRLTLNAHQRKQGQRAHEGATARFAYDDQAIYLRVRMNDAEIRNSAHADQESLFNHGDVAEWYIGRPAHRDPATGELKDGRYIECHVAPTGLRSAYFLDKPPGKRRTRTRHLSPIPFHAKLHVRGKVNDSGPRGKPRETDTRWTVMMILPWKALKLIGPTVHRGSPLTVLVGRYNFGHALPHDRSGASGAPWWIGREMTMWPTLPRSNFYLWRHHAPIHFQPPAGAAK